MSIEAMKQWLEALENATHFVEEYAAGKYIYAHDAAITSLRQAIAEAEQDDNLCVVCQGGMCTAAHGCVALDNPPPQRQWIGLTDEELSAIWGEFGLALMPVRKAIAGEIEAKLKEKNT